jgi:hypothetical protein
MIKDPAEKDAGQIIKLHLDNGLIVQRALQQVYYFIGIDNKITIVDRGLKIFRPKAVSREKKVCTLQYGLIAHGGIMS